MKWASKDQFFRYFQGQLVGKVQLLIQYGRRCDLIVATIHNNQNLSRTRHHIEFHSADKPPLGIFKTIYIGWLWNSFSYILKQFQWIFIGHKMFCESFYGLSYMVAQSRASSWKTKYARYFLNNLSLWDRWDKVLLLTRHIHTLTYIVEAFVIWWLPSQRKSLNRSNNFLVYIHREFVSGGGAIFLLAENRLLGPRRIFSLSSELISIEVFQMWCSF
jgi:hypothetical protein